MSLKIRSNTKNIKSEWNDIMELAKSEIKDTNTKHQFEKWFNNRMKRPDKNFLKWLADSIRIHYLEFRS